MESKAAVKIGTKNPIFKKNKIEWGIIISDNDNCTTAALNSVLHYEIIKHSDKNHTTKGVVKELFSIKKIIKLLRN